MKAQITLFIMIGLILLIAVGITLYVTSFIVTKPKVVKKNVKDFVVDCLKLASEKSFKEIGLNGGYLTSDARAKTSVNNVDYSVLVDAPSKNICSRDVCFYYFQPWKYPWPSFPFKPDSQEKIFTGYFGDSSLLPLHVIKSRLESDIKDKFLECADFNILKQKGIDVHARSDPKVSVFFYNLSYLAEEQRAQERYTTVRLDWPLVESAGIAVAQEQVYSVKLPLRFATMYYSVESLINNDISNISYDPEQFSGMDVKVSRVDGFSLVNVSDPHSRIFGEDFVFVFARKNRAPALWWVDLPEMHFHVSEEGRPTKILIDDEKRTLTFIDPCEDDVVVYLNASDPDEDELFFSTVPKELNLGNNRLKIIVNDKRLTDYQIIEGIGVSLCT